MVKWWWNIDLGEHMEVSLGDIDLGEHRPGGTETWGNIGCFGGP